MIGAPEQPERPHLRSPRRTSLRHTSEPGRSSSARPGRSQEGFVFDDTPARLDRDPLGALDGLHRQVRVLRDTARETGDARRCTLQAMRSPWTERSAPTTTGGSRTPGRTSASCAECVSFKGARFPVRGARAAVGTTGEVLRGEQALLLEPRYDDPEQRLVYAEDGSVASLTDEDRADRDPRPQPRAAARLPARGHSKRCAPNGSTSGKA